MKGSIGTSTRLMFIREWKPTKRELRWMAKVKGNHRIRTRHPVLEKIAKNKREREAIQQSKIKNPCHIGSNWMECFSTTQLNEECRSYQAEKSSFFNTVITLSNHHEM